MKTSAHRLDDSIGRLLIVSDIHSYTQSLEAFDELRLHMEGRNEVIFNGDLFHGGAKPVETAEWVMTNAGEFATIGNHDTEMLRGADDLEYPPFIEAGAYQRLSKNQREYFRNRPHRLEFTWRGKCIVLMHGHIMMDGRPGSWLSPPDEQIANFAESGADLFVTSHTHYAFVREIPGGLYANTGSMSATILGVENAIGLHLQSGKDEFGPGDDPRSSFLSVTESGGKLHLEIVRFDFDRQAALDDLEAAGHPRLKFLRKWLTDGIIKKDS